MKDTRIIVKQYVWTRVDRDTFVCLATGEVKRESELVGQGHSQEVELFGKWEWKEGEASNGEEY